jgi:adenine-specific DNA-methyltransferase
MYPRLMLARELLTDDGVIFVSIDDNEQANLKLLMDDVFGEENFVEIFSWVKTSTPPGLSNKSRKTVEYILAYEKNRNNIKYKGELLDGGDQPLLNSGNSKRILRFPKEKVLFKISDGKYEAGIYDRVTLLETIEVINGISTTDFSLEGEFKWIQSTVFEEIEKGTRFIIKSDKFAIRFIRKNEEGYKAPTNHIKDKFISPVLSKKECGIGTNETSSSELEALMDGSYFNFPKPMSLVKHLVNFLSDTDSIILDFFAGSGTTAHAVMQLNAEDGGNRQFILCQIDEPIKEDSSAYKFCTENGLPPVISSITCDRIKRAGDKIRKEIEEKVQKPDLFKEDKQATLDIGFKVFDLTDAPKLELANGVIRLFDNTELTPLDRIYNLIFKVGIDNPVIVPIETVKDCMYRHGDNYYITHSAELDKPENRELFKTALQNGRVYIDGWTATLNTALQETKGKEDRGKISIVF